MKFDYLFTSIGVTEKLFGYLRINKSDLDMAELFLPKLYKWIELVEKNIEEQGDKLEKFAKTLTKANDDFDKRIVNKYSRNINRIKMEYVDLFEHMIDSRGSYNKLKEIFAGLYDLGINLYKSKHTVDEYSWKHLFYFPAGLMLDDKDLNRPIKNPLEYMRNRLNQIKQWAIQFKSDIKELRETYV